MTGSNGSPSVPVSFGFDCEIACRHRPAEGLRGDTPLNIVYNS